jgi:hypothetical protein
MTILKKIKAFLFPSRFEEIEAYLSESVDHADLERRIKSVSQGHTFFAHYYEPLNFHYRSKRY